jgi:hypothetical protein
MQRVFLDSPVKTALCPNVIRLGIVKIDVNIEVIDMKSIKKLIYRIL